MVKVIDKLEIGIDLDEKEVTKDFKKIEKQSKKTGKKIGKNFKAAVGKLSGAFTGVGAKIAGIGIAFAAAFGAKKIIQAANQQEDAINRLNSALQITGKFSRATSQELQDFASGLQQVTKFGDEAILESQALIQTLGNLSKDTLKEATTATLDLAAALKIDLQSAATLVGKAAAGEVGSFSRYGLIIKKAKTETETFSRALTQIQKKFGGAAQKELGTFGAATQQLANTFGDLTEELGFLITKNPIVLKGVEKLNILFKKMGDNVKDARAEFITLVNRGILNLIISIEKGVEKIKDFIDEWKDIVVIGTGILLIGKFISILAGLKTALSTLGLATLLFNPVTATIAAVAALGLGFVKLKERMKELANEPLDIQIRKTINSIGALENRLARAKERNKDALLFESNTAPLENAISDLEVKLDKLREKRKTAFSGTPEENKAAVDSTKTLLDELKMLLKEGFVLDDEEEGSTGNPIIDKIKPTEEQKAGFLQSFADMFGSLKVNFDNTAATMKKTGDTLAAQFKAGLVKGIAGGIQTIVNNIMSGENAFANFGKFVLGVLADMATQFGMTLIGAGIGVEALKALGGAAAIAAGAGLVALGAVLKNLSGGGETASAASFSGGGGDVSATVQDDDIAQVSDEEEREAKTVISANFLGPILDRKESALAIIEILQEGFDEEGVQVIKGFGAA